VNVGVIGLGMIGETMKHVLGFYHTVYGFDIAKPCDPWDSMLKTDVVFICVPTPVVDGRLNHGIVESVLGKLEDSGYEVVVSIKSTLGLGYGEHLSDYGLSVVVNPEFLHEKTRLSDYSSPSIIVLGGKLKDTSAVLKVFNWVPRETRVIETSYNTAILIKLVMNAYASTKITFANQVKRISDETGSNAGTIMGALAMDKRCSKEYSNPYKGAFGGACLPKDLQELMNGCENNALWTTVWGLNEAFRRDYG